MTVTAPCPKCKKVMYFDVYIDTDHGSLYVAANGVCPKCGARFDAYGFSYRHPKKE